MSRIGKLPINLPEGVEIKVSDDNIVTVKGKLGELTQAKLLNEGISNILIEANAIGLGDLAVLLHAQ